MHPPPLPPKKLYQGGKWAKYQNYPTKLVVELEKFAWDCNVENNMVTRSHRLPLPPSTALYPPHTKNPKFLCGYRKRHSFQPQQGLDTLTFLLLQVRTLCPGHSYLCYCTWIKPIYCSQCTHFAWSSLLNNLTLASHTCGAHTVLGSVILLYTCMLVQYSLV